MSIITIYDAKQYSGMRKAEKICKITLQEGLEPSTSRYHVANKPIVVEVLRATIAPLEPLDCSSATRKVYMDVNQIPSD